MNSIVERVFKYAEETPDNIAVIIENEVVSYSELWNAIVRLAHLFKKLGLRDGDRVVCQCKYDLYFIASIYATGLCNAAAVPAGKDVSDESIRNLAEQIDARLVICNHKSEGDQNNVIYEELSDILPHDTSMEGLSFPDMDSVEIILFTTGTTGAPKGVQITHRGATDRLRSRLKEFNASTRDRCITTVPLNHMAPISVLERHLYCGGTMIFLDGMIKIGKMFEYIEKYAVSSIYLPPAGISLLQILVKEKLADYSDQLDYILVGSAAMTVSQQEYTKKMLSKSKLYSAYASSEAGVVTLYRYDISENGINFCGKPSEGMEIKIVDDELQSVKTGQIGLIAIKSESVMKGYYNLPDLNREVLKDGYFISNDLGYLDEEGFLYVCGRKDDMINIGGLKVYPSEIENATLRIPGIIDCICFGVPDPVTGHKVKLLIQTDGSSMITAEHVQDSLSHVMDYYKVPKIIEFVSEIAKTANGKPDRKYYQQ